MKSRYIYLMIIAIVSACSVPVHAGDKVDVNTATKAELAILPGLGPITAEKVVVYREKHNGFKSVDELENIKGIGRERLIQIKTWATVSIPKEGEKLQKEKQPISEDNKLDVNKASITELELLPGIGPKIANNIVEYRSKNNGFKSIQELMYIKGIGMQKYEDIKDLITVGKR